MSTHDQPSEPPRRSSSPEVEEVKDDSELSISLEFISLALDLVAESDTSSPSSSSEEEAHRKTETDATSIEEEPERHPASKNGRAPLKPVTEAAHIELADVEELTAFDIPNNHEPLEGIFHGRYSPDLDTWVRNPDTVVNENELDVILTAFGVAFWFVTHNKSLQLLSELMCIGMPLGWVHSMNCMITRVLATFRWVVVIDQTLKPNVMTCWAGPGLHNHPSAGKAIYISARHIKWLVRARLRGDLVQYSRRLMISAACIGEDIVECVRFLVREQFAALINKDIMPGVNFRPKQTIDKWPSNLGWVWHLKFFGGWFVGIGKIADNIDGFMKMIPCRGPCNLDRLGILVPTGKHYPLTMKLVDDDWIIELIHSLAQGTFQQFRMTPETLNPFLPLHNCRVVHSLHKNFDWAYARAQNMPVPELRETNEIGTLISTYIPSETRCPESEVFHFDPPIQEPEELLVQITSQRSEDLEKFLIV